ncbi:DciA family protein [Streptomyces sp. NPDC048516]|uniref:DciA family protein n=1 Tax=Streptomyces sp. NPDC048516 TaxID=3365565 RepID=UPI003721097F
MPEPSGKDICREALAAYKKSTWAIPANKQSNNPKRPRIVRRGTGRDPVGLGSVVETLSTDQDWQTGIKGSSLRDRWNELCPTELCGKVEPTSYDKTRGCLTLKPSSDAAASFLRMFGQQLVTSLQKQGAPVRAIRLERVGPLSSGQPAAPELTQEPVALGPVKTRDTASPGYRAAFEAIKATARTETDVQQRTRAAAERQTAAMRTHREPDDEHAEAVWFADDLEAKNRAERDQLIRRLAREHKADREAGSIPEIRTAFQRTA